MFYDVLDLLPLFDIGRSVKLSHCGAVNHLSCRETLAGRLQQLNIGKRGCSMCLPRQLAFESGSVRGVAAFSQMSGESEEAGCSGRSSPAHV